MGRACSTNGWRRGMHIGYSWERQKEIDHWEDEGIGRCTILSRILDRMRWIGLIWLRIGTTGGLL
jgi:hypothetical protein